MIDMLWILLIGVAWFASDHSLNRGAHVHSAISIGVLAVSTVSFAVDYFILRGVMAWTY